MRVFLSGKKWASFCSDNGISLYCRSNDIASFLYSYSGSATSHVIYFFSFFFSFYFLVLVLCSPIVPMGVSIPRVDISQDTRIKIHLAFASELLPELILFVIMHTHTHTHTSPSLSLSPSLWSDPINHPSDTVYLSFTSFPLWLMEEHSFRFSTTQISFSLFYLFFFSKGKIEWRLLISPQTFFFFAVLNGDQCVF
jgi:hypothetical protein